MGTVCIKLGQQERGKDCRCHIIDVYESYAVDAAQHWGRHVFEVTTSIAIRYSTMLVSSPAFLLPAAWPPATVRR
jgi:hypothetical protein